MTARAREVARDPGGAAREVVAASDWLLRCASPALAPSAPPVVSDFRVVLDRELGLWIAARGARELATFASVEGVAVDLSGDLTFPSAHDVVIRERPGDEAKVRWACSCGAGSRRDTARDAAEEAAGTHVVAAAARSARRSHDDGVDQDGSGAWSRRRLAVVRRVTARVHSDRSIDPVHQRGHGEEVELVVDVGLSLWGRLAGSEAFLRRDLDGSGISYSIREYLG